MLVNSTMARCTSVADNTEETCEKLTEVDMSISYMADNYPMLPGKGICSESKIKMG